MTDATPTDGDIPYQATAQRAKGPSAEKVIWKGHPALRSTFYLWIVAIAVTYGIHVAFPYISAAITYGVEATGLMSEAWQADILYWSHALYALPAFYVGIKTLARFLISYELTSQRIILHSGLLVRRRNEVALHRIRDYQVERPIYWAVLGIGYLLIVSRDESLPTLRIGPVPRPNDVIDQIRDAAFVYKREMGYREFESW